MKGTDKGHMEGHQAEARKAPAPSKAARVDVDDDIEHLSRALAALGLPSRLHLLRKLQVPRTMADIALSPARRSAAGSLDRTLSRQAVQHHLRQLLRLGIIQARAVRRGPRPSTEYVVNHARMFTLVEELRRYALARPSTEDTVMPTEGAPAASAVELPDGPCVVLVNGPFEGTAFRLEGKGPWVAGRDRDIAVALRYDPFVSQSNTLIWLEGGRYWVRSLPKARNGTSVNWRLLAPNESCRLGPGDVLGLGRSLLIFRGS